MREEDQLARWFETFLDVLKVAYRRDYGIAVNFEHKDAMQDMMERAFEDELYPYDSLPPLVVHKEVPPGEYRWVEKSTMKVLSMRAGVNARTGLGRLKRLWTPDESKRRLN